MRIWADNYKLRYSGRIDKSDSKNPVFVFPCTSVEMKFTGNSLSLYVRNRNAYWDNYIGVILDGEQQSVKLPNEQETVLEINLKNTQNSEHNVLVFKRQDSCHELVFSGFEIDDAGEVLDLDRESNRRIEVYGDSVSAGEVSEAVDYTGKEDPVHNGEYSNSWYSYAWLTARKLNAQIHDIAQGGIALLDKTGWFYEPDAIGMETVWDKIHYNPEFGNTSKWDFANYIPQVVIVAFGQNDSHPEDYMKEDYNGEKAVKWRKHYKLFLEMIREKYKDAYIICITTLLEHDASWDRAIAEAVSQMNDEKIVQYLFKRNGCGTPGHLRIPEAEEMAEELSSYIESLNIY